MFNQLMRKTKGRCETESTTLNVKSDAIKSNAETLVDNNSNSNNENNADIILPKSTAPKSLNTRMRMAAIQPNSTDSKMLMI